MTEMARYMTVGESSVILAMKYLGLPRSQKGPAYAKDRLYRANPNAFSGMKHAPAFPYAVEAI